METLTPEQPSVEETKEPFIPVPTTEKMPNLDHIKLSDDYMKGEKRQQLIKEQLKKYE
jgi:hypothetical protein